MCCCHILLKQVWNNSGLLPCCVKMGLEWWSAVAIEMEWWSAVAIEIEWWSAVAKLCQNRDGTVTCCCHVVLKQEWNGDLLLPCCVKMEWWYVIAMLKWEWNGDVLLPCCIKMEMEWWYGNGMVICCFHVVLKWEWNGDLLLPCCVKMEVKWWSAFAMLC